MELTKIRPHSIFNSLFINLPEYKCKYNFQDTLNPLCICGCDIENTCHFLLHCHNFLAETNTLFNKITDFHSSWCYSNQFTSFWKFEVVQWSQFEVSLKFWNAIIDSTLRFKSFDKPFNFLIIRISSLFIRISLALMKMIWA